MWSRAVFLFSTAAVGRGSAEYDVSFHTFTAGGSALSCLRAFSRYMYEGGTRPSFDAAASFPIGFLENNGQTRVGGEEQDSVRSFQFQTDCSSLCSLRRFSFLSVVDCCCYLLTSCLSNLTMLVVGVSQFVRSLSWLGLGKGVLVSTCVFFVLKSG